MYREVQRFRQWWIWLVVVLVVGLAWWTFVQQILFGRPFGTNPAPDWVVGVIFALVGVGLPILVTTVKLVVTVEEDGLRVAYVPFRQRRLTWSDLASWEVVTYKPIRHYGGWGIRWRPGAGWAYTVRGDRGVMLHLEDGSQLLVGSGDAEALAKALDAHRR